MFEYFLGIDGGGTKTDFALADINGRILKSITLGASNPNDIGIENTLSLLDNGMDTICSEFAKEKMSVFAGLAGASSADYEKIIYTHLKRKGFALIGNGIDAQNAVAASLGYRDGITIIMGTGAIALTQKNRKLFRTGGYGYLFADEGSGYEIGKDAILASLKDEAGYGENTLLTALIKEKIGHDKILDGISDFYRGGKRYIADFAPTVFAAFDLNDNVAKKILKKNMCGIAELILGASKHLNKENIEVCLCGGITRQADTILPLIREALGKESEKFNIRICARPQVYGALLLAGMEEK